MNKLSYLLVAALICYSCGQQNAPIEKHQNKRDKKINVREKVKEIEITDVLVGGVSRLSLIDGYLIIRDTQTQDKLLHIFNKNTFEYIASRIDRGQGPGEIANIGHIGVNEKDRLLYVSDHGKQAIFSYPLDSLFANPSYTPEVKMRMNEKLFPDKYDYMNDTLCVGLVINPIGSSNFKPSVAKWNMNTGKIDIMKYEHPDINDSRKRISYAASAEHGIYVECHTRYDLMSICDLNGGLKCNVYGKNWNTQRSGCYSAVRICGDKIVALYLGEDSSNENSAGNANRFPTKFHVFSIEGDYILSLDTGYRITDFCYDKENERIMMVFDDEIQFGYLDLHHISELKSF